MASKIKFWNKDSVYVAVPCFMIVILGYNHFGFNKRRSRAERGLGINAWFVEIRQGIIIIKHAGIGNTVLGVYCLKLYRFSSKALHSHIWPFLTLCLTSDCQLLLESPGKTATWLSVIISRSLTMFRDLVPLVDLSLPHGDLHLYGAVLDVVLLEVSTAIPILLLHRSAWHEICQA